MKMFLKRTCKLMFKFDVFFFEILKLWSGLLGVFLTKFVRNTPRRPDHNFNISKINVRRRFL